MPYIGKTPTVGNFQVCDAISVVNGQAAYTLQVGGTNVAPESANHMLVSLNGILQKPGSSFTISGSTMTFASNLATGDVIDFVQILGNVLDLGTPSDDTVTAAKLNNDIISGQTALTSAPDDTDEFLVSDAGTIKRIDYSLIKGVGKIVQVAQSVSTTAVTPSSATIITSLDFTPTSSSNKVLLFANCAQIRKADAGTGSAASIRIFVGSTATNAQSSNEGYPESESDTRGNITTIGHHDCWSGQQTVSVKSDGFGSNVSYSYQDSPTTLIVMEVEQ